MGTVLAPGIVILATLVHAQFVPWLPLGGAGLVAAAAAMALPETLGLPISDTIQVSLDQMSQLAYGMCPHAGRSQHEGSAAMYFAKSM